MYGTITEEFGYEAQHPIYVIDIAPKWWTTHAVKPRGINHMGSIPHNIYAAL